METPAATSDLSPTEGHPVAFAVLFVCLPAMTAANPTVALLSNLSEIRLSLISTLSEAVERLGTAHFDLVMVGVSAVDSRWFAVVPRLVASMRAGSLLFVCDQKSPAVLRTLAASRRASIFDPAEGAPDALSAALVAVVRGKHYVSPSIARMLEEPVWRDIRAKLTEGDAAILSIIGTGCRDKEAADLLRMNPKTVRWRRGRLMQRFGLHDRRQLQDFALRFGYAACGSDGVVCPVAICHDS